MRILILPYGWVFVGKYTVDPATNEHVLNNASVVRIWGTTKGLGEIALGGPTLQTILDYCGTMRCKDVVAMLMCDETKWNR